jgi:nucleotide-binding universal stress UspA family protein
MKRILAAVDLSPMAAEVIREAANLAQLNDAVVSVIHVLSEHDAQAMLQSHAQRNIEHSHDWTQPEERADAIAEQAAYALKEYGVRYESFGFIGDAPLKILDEAQVQNAEIIVIGFHGLHGLGKVRALGSVSRTVMENADCPVLIVPALKAADIVTERAIEAQLQVFGV